MKDIWMNLMHQPITWKNHLNFTWSQDETLGAHIFDQPYLRPNQVLNNQLDFDPKEGVNILEKSLKVLAQSTSNIKNTLNNFMQATDQLLK